LRQNIKQYSFFSMNAGLSHARKPAMLALVV